MRIYVLFAHPDPESFNGQLAAGYCSAAIAAGHEVRRQDLFELEFDPILRLGLRAVQPLEVDLIAARANLDWCQHFVLFYPVWWGNVPAVLKGFFDRALYSEITYHHDVDDPSCRRTTRLPCWPSCPTGSDRAAPFRYAHRSSACRRGRG